MSGAVWLTSADVAERVHRSRSTIRRAAETADLHGHQPLRDGRPLRKGTWTFATAAVDAWVQGHDERAQREACGCARLQLALRRAS